MSKMIHNKKRCIVLLVILGAFIISVPYGHAQDDETTRSTLRGLQGIFVYVEPLDPQIEQSGLFKSQIQTDTESQLKSAGIRVLTREDFLKGFGRPYLYINLKPA